MTTRRTPSEPARPAHGGPAAGHGSQKGPVVSNPALGDMDRDAVDAAYDNAVISQVIRPSAIVPEEAAGTILMELSLNSVANGGTWLGEPSRWKRYDSPWRSATDQGGSELIGIIQIAYGTPTKYEITIYRVTITRRGQELGWTVESLTDEALAFGDLTLAECPRAGLKEPPAPFRY